MKTTKQWLYRGSIGIFFAAVPLFVFAHETEGVAKVIHMTDAGFEPASIRIVAGTKVIFENSGSIPRWPASNIHPTHTVYPGSNIEKCGTEEGMFDACRGVERGESWSFVFDKPGAWRYHDHLESSAGGVIEVAGEREPSGVSEKKSPFSFLSRVKILLKKFQFSMSSLYKERTVGALHMNELAETRDDTSVDFWMAVLGPANFMDEVVRDAPTLRIEGRTFEECHLDAHVAGRSAYRVFGQKIFQSAIDSRCQFGFYHGSFEVYLGEVAGEDFVADFYRQCAGAKEPVQRIQCEHGLGHGLMVYQNYDLPATLARCGELSAEGAQMMCYHGAFMENLFSYFNLAVGDHVSQWVDPTKADLNFPCNIAAIGDTSEREAVCYFIQTFFWAEPVSVSSFNADAVFAGCARAPERSQGLCYQGAGFSVSVMPSIGSNEGLLDFCRRAPSDGLQEQCLAGVLFARAVHWRQDYVSERDALCRLFAPTSVSACGRQLDRLLEWVYER